MGSRTWLAIAALAVLAGMVLLWRGVGAETADERPAHAARTEPAPEAPTETVAASSVVERPDDAATTRTAHVVSRGAGSVVASPGVRASTLRGVLRDRAGRPLPFTELDIAHGEGELTLTTDESGRFASTELIAHGPVRITRLLHAVEQDVAVHLDHRTHVRPEPVCVDAPPLFLARTVGAELAEETLELSATPMDTTGELESVPCAVRRVRPEWWLATPDSAARGGLERWAGSELTGASPGGRWFGVRPLQPGLPNGLLIDLLPFAAASVTIRPVVEGSSSHWSVPFVLSPVEYDEAAIPPQPGRPRVDPETIWLLARMGQLTDSDGGSLQCFEPLFPGTYELRAHSPGLEPFQRSFRLAAGEHLELDAVLRPLPDHVELSLEFVLADPAGPAPSVRYRIIDLAGRSVLRNDTLPASDWTWQGTQRVLSATIGGLPADATLGLSANGEYAGPDGQCRPIPVAAPVRPLVPGDLVVGTVHNEHVRRLRVLTAGFEPVHELLVVGGDGTVQRVVRWPGPNPLLVIDASRAALVRVISQRSGADRRPIRAEVFLADGRDEYDDPFGRVRVLAPQVR